MRRRGARPRTGTFPKKAMITDARRSRLATTPLERVRAHADYTEARCQQRVAILGHTLQIARTRRLRPLERLELQERLDAATAALINARRHKSWVSSHPDEAVAHGVEDGAIDDAFAELKEEFADFELVDWGWVARAFSDQLGGVVSHNLKAAFEAEAARRAGAWSRGGKGEAPCPHGALRDGGRGGGRVDGRRREIGGHGEGFAGDDGVAHRRGTCWLGELAHLA